MGSEEKNGVPRVYVHPGCINQNISWIAEGQASSQNWTKTRIK